MFQRTLIRYYYSSRYSATATISDSTIKNNKNSDSTSTNRILVLRNGVQSFIDYIKENKRLKLSPIVLITSLPLAASNTIPGSISKSTLPKSTTITNNNDKYTNEICSYISYIIQQQFNLRVIIVNYPLLPFMTTGGSSSSSNSSNNTSTTVTTGHTQQTQSSIFPLQTDIDKTIELANRIGAKTVIGVGTESTINLAKAVALYRYNSTGSTGTTGTSTLELLFKEVVLLPTTYNSIVASSFSHSLLLNYKEETIDIYPSLPIVLGSKKQEQQQQQQQQQQQSNVPLISTTIVPVEASRMHLLSSFTKLKTKLSTTTTKEENDHSIILYNKDINDTIVTVLGLLSVLLDILLYDCNQSHHKHYLTSIVKTEESTAAESTSIVTPVSLLHLMKTLQNGIVIIQQLQHLSNQLQKPMSSDEATTSTSTNNFDTINIDELHDTIISFIFDCSNYVSFGDKYAMDIPNNDSNTGTTTTTTSTGSTEDRKKTTTQYRSVSLGIAVSFITKIFPDYTIIEIMSSIGTTLCEQIVTNSSNQQELVELINSETNTNNNNTANTNTNSTSQQQLFQQLLLYYQQYTPLLLSRETHQTIINEIQSNQIVWNTIPIDRSTTILSNIIKHHQFII